MLCGMIAGGCGEAEQAYQFRDTSHKKPFFDKADHKIAGRSVEGRPLRYSVHGDGDEIVFIMGGIHGNEISGIKIAEKLEKYLLNKPYMAAGKTIIVMPIANPDGYAKGTRHNANGIDLNRNFDTGNRVNNTTNGDKGFTEPESRAIARIIRRYDPDRIISIHSPLGCVDYDGYAAGLAYRISSASHLPVRKLGSRPGSLGSYAGVELGIPMVTFEATSDDDKLSADTLWRKYGNALLIAIDYKEYAK